MSTEFKSNMNLFLMAFLSPISEGRLYFSNHDFYINISIICFKTKPISNMDINVSLAVLILVGCRGIWQLNILCLIPKLQYPL